MSTEKDVTLTVNGTDQELTVEPRTLLVHALREELDLTGTHVGCDTGNCGACTVQLDGEAVKSCMLFAAQADGSDIRTVEGMADRPEADDLHPLQAGFKEMHGLQCGFCTPGMIMAGDALLSENPDPSEDEIRTAISGNLCRCTGYQNIVKAVEYAADVLNDREPPEPEAEAATDGGVDVDGGADVETDGGGDVAEDGFSCGPDCGCSADGGDRR